MIFAVIVTFIPAIAAKADGEEEDNYTVIVLEDIPDNGYSLGGKKVYTVPCTLKMVKKTAKEALSTFENSRNNEHIAVIAYNYYGAYVVSDFTTDCKDLNNKIKDMKGSSSSGCNMTSGLMKAESMLASVEGKKKNVIIVNSGHAQSNYSKYSYSGHYNSSATGDWQWNATRVKSYAYSNSAYDAAKSLKKIAKVYSVCVMPDGYPAKVKIIIKHKKKLSKDIASKNCYYDAKNIKGLKKALAKITQKEVEKIDYSVDTENSLFGTVECPNDARVGDSITIKAIPSVGYSFDGWYNGSDVVSYDNPYTFTVTKKGVNLKAHFKWDEAKTDDDIAQTGEKDKNLKEFTLVGKSKDNTLELTWPNVGDDMTYEVYLSVCDGGDNYEKVGTTTTNSCVIDNLDNDKAYKGFVLAYNYVDDAKLYTAKAISVHVAMPEQPTLTNAKSVSVKEDKVTIKKGKSAKISASIKPDDSKKELVSHVAEFRYLSSDPKVATVDKNGKIVGVKKGKCSVFVIANNGVNKKISVTVK